MAPFLTPSEKTGSAIGKTAPSVLIGGLSLGFGVHVHRLCARVLVNEMAS